MAGRSGIERRRVAWNERLERVFAPKLVVLPAHQEDAVRADPLAVREHVIVEINSYLVDAHAGFEAEGSDACEDVGSVGILRFSQDDGGKANGSWQVGRRLGWY